MRITASKRDDILRERDEYNEEAKKQNAIHEQQEQNYDFASDYNDAQIENAIRSQVPGLDDVTIRVDSYYGRSGIRVSFNSESRRDDKSLRWSWDVMLDGSGEITKESSSWSGLEATTSAQIEDLQKTVSILSNLVSLDWKPILEQGIQGKPNYYDYVAVPSMKSRESEFNERLKAADIEELIGTNKWVRGKGERGWDRWYNIQSQTEKFYSVASISAWDVQHIEPDRVKSRLESAAKFPEKIKKVKLMPYIDYPLTVMNENGNIESTSVSEEAVETEASSSIVPGLITI